MMPVYGIPSHDRSKSQPTIEYLLKLGIPPERINLCVWDNELSDYQKWKPYVNNIFTTQAHNAAGGRNQLLDNAREKFIVLLDDDISSISYLQNGKLIPILNNKLFSDFIRYGFATCFQAGAKLWGLYPVSNAYFMKNKITDWALIVGTFLGIIDDGMRFNTAYTLKEDFDFSCRSLKQYGSVTRFDNVVPIAKHHSKGGCEKQWPLNKLYYDQIIREHSDILKPNSKRENEVLLKRRGSN